MALLRTAMLLATMVAAAFAINVDDAAAIVPPPVAVASAITPAYLETHSLSLESYLAMPVAARAQLVSSSYPSLFAAVLDKRHDDSDEAVSEEDAEELMAMLSIKYGATGPWAWLKCKICQKSIGFFVGKVTKYGCGKVTAFSAAICEVAGLGPADPLSSICIAAVITACPIVAKQIANKVTNPDKICRAIHWCN